MMRKKLFLAVVLCAALLAGCASREESVALLRQAYGTATAEAKASITSHGGFFCTYTVEMKETPEGFCTTVLQPDSVKGVAAHLSSDGMTLSFDDVALETLTPQEEGFSPADALPFLILDLRREMPTAFCEETVNGEKRLSLEYQEETASGRTAWKRISLEKESLFLREAELYLDGNLILSVQCEKLTLTPQKPLAEMQGLCYTEPKCTACFAFA